MLSKLLYFITGNSKKYLEELESRSPEPAKKDISEPVISFINAVKDNPRRFKIVGLNRQELLDRHSGERFAFITRHKLVNGSLREVYEPKQGYLTDDEKELLSEEISGVFYTKRTKLRRLLRERANRIHQKERDRLKEIYCDL